MPKMHRQHPPHEPGRKGRISRSLRPVSAVPPVTTVDVVPVRRIFPHVDHVQDPAAQATTRMLWDRVHDLEGRLTAQEGTSLKLEDAANEQADQIAALHTGVHHALSAAQSAAASNAAKDAADSSTPPTGGTPQFAPAPANHLDIVNAAIASLGLTVSSPPALFFDFIRTVVWNINALGADPAAGSVGLLAQGGGDGVYTCSGATYACWRLTYTNGANIKVLIQGPPFTGDWTQQGDVDKADWRAPIAPGTPCV